jgi:predicted phage terminase large subunit-like protein
MPFRDRDIAIARSSPLGFASVTGRGKFAPARHLVLLNEFILDRIFGPRKRGMIFMPPRHGKSTLISRATAAFYLGTFPDRQVGVASYEADFAKGWGRAVRSDMTEFGDEIFGLRVSGDSSASDRWGLAGHQGGMRTAGVEGRWTGLGFHLLIIDDPVKDAKQAHSKAYRDACAEWMRSVAESRLEPDATVLMVMTRWHEDDLAGRSLMTQPGDWDVLSLPAIAESESDALGRSRGEALWPERFPVASLLSRKGRVGSYWWAAQYQQRPSPEEGNRVRRDWWKFWSSQPQGMERIVTSTDCAFKDTEDSSFVVMQAWGVRGGDAYLLDQLRARMDFPETLRAFEGFHRKWNVAAAKLVEDKANGPAVIASLRRKIPGIIPIEVSGKGSKIARLSAVSPFIESGNVYLPDPRVFSWVDDFINELATFPNGTNDDQVDATSQALTWVLTQNHGARSVAQFDVPRTSRASDLPPGTMLNSPW